MKTNSNIKPEMIEVVGNGNYFFNYDIEEIENENGIFYNYQQIEVSGYPTYECVVSAIIKDHFDYDFRECAVRKGVLNSNDEDFVSFNAFAENTKIMVKDLLNK